MCLNRQRWSWRCRRVRCSYCVVHGRADSVTGAAKRMTRDVAYALAAALALMPSAGWSATTMLVASKDNSIFGNNADNSNGGGAGVFVGTTSTMQMNSVRRGLLEFDVAGAVPAGAKISEVN